MSLTLKVRESRHRFEFTGEYGFEWVVCFISANDFKEGKKIESYFVEVTHYQEWRHDSLNFRSYKKPSIKEAKYFVEEARKEFKKESIIK
jgi:hypothetical protein